MISKFSVFSKFYKCFKIKQNSLRTLFDSKGPKIGRRYFSKTSVNLIIPKQNNNKILAKDVSKFGITRNMSSGQNNNDEGDENIKKTSGMWIKKSKKKILRRKSKVKSLKSSYKKCKRCNKQNNANKEKLITENIPNKNLPDATKDQDILQTQLPPKKVHVEFMESKNLIDFNPPTQPLNTKNIKQSIIDIKITPIIPINENFNIDSIKKDIKKTIYNLESNHLTKPNRDNVNKDILKTDQNATIKEQHIEKSPRTITDDIDNIEKLMEKVSRKSENIRILYQAHPKRKTKIRIPKIGQMKKVKKLKQESFRNSLTLEEASDSFIGKGSLFPTKYGEYPNFEKLETKNFKYNIIDSFTTFRKGILYPTEMNAIQSKKTFEPKSDLRNNKKKLYNRIKTAPVKIKNETKPLPNIDADSLQIPMTKFENNPDVFKENNENLKLLPNNANTNILKHNKNRTALPKSSGTSISSTDKLQNNINSNNQTLHESGTPAKKTMPKNDGTGVIKTNKFTKYKIPNGVNNHGGSKGGDAPPTKFWRNISFTILPLIFGLTIYTMCNIEAADMFKRMRDGRFGEDPIAMKILPTFYGKKSKTEAKNFKDSDKENLKLEEPVEEPRLDEA